MTRARRRRPQSGSEPREDPPSPKGRPGHGQRVLLTVAAVVIVVAGLKAASDILVPMAVAAFLAIICLPAIVFLQRTRLPLARWGPVRRVIPAAWLPRVSEVQLGAPIAVILVVFGLLGAFVGTAALVGTSIDDFQATIHEYRTHQRDLSPGAERVLGWFKRIPELVGSADEPVGDATKEVVEEDGAPPGVSPGEEVDPGEPASEGAEDAADDAGSGGGLGHGLAIDPDLILEFALSLVAGTGTLLSNSFLVLMVAALLLLEAAGLPAKLRQAFGDPTSDLKQATEVVRKIQRYLWIKTIISAATGTLLGFVCWLCDVEFPVLWGVVAFGLNYVPNIGSIIAMIPPALLAFAQNGVVSTIWVVVGYGVVNVVVGNLVEPMLMGRQLGLSPLVVFLSMVFWGWTWGAIGMFLSVPLTMSVKIFLENTKDLRWIALLMANAPATGPPGGGAVESALNPAPAPDPAPAPAPAPARAPAPERSRRRRRRRRSRPGEATAERPADRDAATPSGEQGSVPPRRRLRSRGGERPWVRESERKHHPETGPSDDAAHSE